MLKKLLKWLLGFVKPNGLYKYKFVDNVPEKLHLGTIYIVGNEGYYWQGVMMCPCGCGEKLYVNFMEDQHPSWIYKIDDKKNISLYPSLWRKIGCQSHFFIKEGKTIWV